MKVVPYSKEYKNEFIEMNKRWITEMFRLEDEDIAVLNNIDGIVANGGEVCFTLSDEGEVMSCCMLEPHGDEWEIAKFATKPEFGGKGAGKLCLDACIEKAREKGIKKLLIVSNTKCHAALSLYRKAGFKEIPVDKSFFKYDRGNIAFEMYL